jgi:antitoxin (DNA-binding transcriptional repressor) of toxin-antitoxin stability system
MVTVNFTQFRQNAKNYLDAVEKGEMVNIKRHGKIVAQIIPPQKKQPSWKRQVKPLEISGVQLSRSVIQERRKTR